MAEEEDEFQQCKECGKEIKTKRAMLTHLDRHGGIPASCRSCRCSFNSIAALNYHFDIFCARRKKKCPQCKVFLPSTCYNSHIEAHSRNNCLKCPSLFTNRKNLVAHMEDAHNIVILADAAFLCTAQDCDRTFVKRSTLYHHMQLKHAAKGVFVCLFCGVYIEGKEVFDAHVLTHKKWSCTECNKSFTRRQQFIEHKLRHEQKKYRCITCDQSFPTKLRVLEHRALGHEVAGLSQKGLCPVCGETFYTEQELKSHASQHKSERFPCETCGRTFLSGKTLAAHIWSKHQSEPAPKVKKASKSEGIICDHCGKHYKRQSLLATHLNNLNREKCFACALCDYRTKYEVNLQRHTALHTAQPDQQFVCDQCGAAFKALSTLKDHYLFAHSDERNFKCEKCSKTFKRRTDLNRHSRTHSDERLYVCHCNETYKFVAHLRRHQRVAHKDTGKYTKKDECPLPPISTLPDISRPHELQSFQHFNFVSAAERVAHPSLLPIPLSQFELVDQVESCMGIEHDIVFGVNSTSTQSPNLMSLGHHDSVMISLNVAKADGLNCDGDGNELNEQVMVSHSQIATMTEFMTHQLGLEGTQDVPWTGDLEEGLAMSVFN